MSLPGPLIAIVGPTASGKSALAERIACELGTSIISVVYGNSSLRGS